MNKLSATFIFFVVMTIGSACIFFSSCKEKSRNEMIVFTRSSGKPIYLDFYLNDSSRYIPHAQIVELDPNNPEGSLRVLTTNYYSASSPQISFDGKYLLFAGKQKQNDLWQIWEMNLRDLKTRQISSSKENCTDPAYLPGGRLVFSKYAANDTLKAGHSLYTCNLDGSNLQRITFNPHTYLASNILSDGRVLTVARQIFPEKGEQMFMILRPDGTKADMFYKGTKDTFVSSPGVETNNGRIVFIESDKVSLVKDNLISISYNRPLHSRVNLTSEIGGDFRAVCPLRSGKLIVSYRKTESDRYALYEFDQDNKTLGKAVYNNAEYDVLEAVESGKHARPKKLPSEVDMGVKTGLILCQDINVSDSRLSDKAAASHRSARIEIVGIDSTLGFVDVETDGSFYLKVTADTPFKMQTVDKDGKVLHNSSAWIWLRPNERRGCVGCHQDPEMAPSNRVPLSVNKSPAVIPAHVNNVVEKKISLE